MTYFDRMIRQLLGDIERLKAEIDNYWNCDKKDPVSWLECMKKPADGLLKLYEKKCRLEEELSIYMQIRTVYRDVFERLKNKSWDRYNEKGNIEAYRGRISDFK